MKKLVLFAALAFTVWNAAAQTVKNEMLKGYKPGDKLVKSAYDSATAPIQPDTWVGAFVATPLEGVEGPKVGEPLSYPGYPEEGLSIQMGGFPKEIKGHHSSVYALTENKGEFRKGACYVAFLMNMKRLGGGGFVDLVGMDLSYVGNGNRGKFFVGRTEDNKRMRFSTAARKAVDETGPYEFGKTYLIVLKMDFTKQEMALFVNPDLNGTEPQPTLVSKAEPGEIKNGIRSIYVRQRRNYEGALGNFRFADTWAGAIGK